MKRIMSMRDLQRYYSEQPLRQFKFCTVNQSWDKVRNPMKADLSFSKMLISCNPNVICLRNGESVMYFERVKYVHVDADSSPLGTVFDIICGDSTNKENDMHYTLIGT